MIEKGAVVCDLCGTKTKGATASHVDGVEWKGKVGGPVENTTVAMEEGYAHLIKGVHLKGRSYHVCPTCFREKLEPWLQEQGAQATMEEVRHEGQN